MAPEEDHNLSDSLADAIRMWYWWRAIDRAYAERDKFSPRLADLWQQEASSLMSIAAELETILIFLTGKPNFFNQKFQSGRDRELNGIPITNGFYDLNKDLMRSIFVSDN